MDAQGFSPLTFQQINRFRGRRPADAGRRGSDRGDADGGSGRPVRDQGAPPEEGGSFEGRLVRGSGHRQQ